MASTPHTFGTRLAWLRKRRGLSQAQLSKLADVRERDFTRWETDQNFPRGEATLRRLAAALDVPVGALFGELSDEEAAAAGLPARADLFPTLTGNRRRGERGTRRASGDSESKRRRS